MKNMNCRKCGAPLDAFHEYCGKCGTKHSFGKKSDGTAEKIREFVETEDDGGCGCGGGSGYDRRGNDGGCDGCARGAAAGGCLDAMDGRGCSDGCFIKGCLAGGCLGSLFG